MRALVGVAVALAACGGSAPADPDAMPLDAAIDAPCGAGCGQKYVIDRIDLPLDASESEQFGFDLDEDGTVDNQLGNVLSAFVQASGSNLDLQGVGNEAVDRGAVLVLASVGTCGTATCFWTFLGAEPAPAPCTDPDDPTTCRLHLAGTGTFSISPASAADQVVAGVRQGEILTAGPGTAQLQLVLGGRMPIDLQLAAARARLTGIGEETVDYSTLGGGIPAADLDGEVIPGLHASIADLIAQDCSTTTPPDCGCAPASDGETYLGIFDENEDCLLPLDEFRGTALIATLVRPDVDTDGDGVADMMSVGVAFSAVRASFDP